MRKSELIFVSLCLLQISSWFSYFMKGSIVSDWLSMRWHTSVITPNRRKITPFNLPQSFTRCQHFFRDNLHLWSPMRKQTVQSLSFTGWMQFLIFCFPVLKHRLERKRCLYTSTVTQNNKPCIALNTMHSFQTKRLLITHLCLLIKYNQGIFVYLIIKIQIVIVYLRYNSVHITRFSVFSSM